MDPLKWILPGPVHAILAVAWLLWWSFRPQRRPTGPIVRGVLAIWLVLAWAGATPAMGHWLAGRLERQVPRVALEQLGADPATTILVLASGSMFRPDGSLDVELDDEGLNRTRTAIRLWQRTGGQLVFVGGPGHSPTDSLAGAMAREARSAGVPAEAIRTLGGTRSTREDLVAAAGQRMGAAGPAWLVTSAMHMPRALATAQALALRIRPFPCPPRHTDSLTGWAWMPAAADPALWRSGWHEWLGLAYYAARGWVSRDAEVPIVQ